MPPNEEEMIWADALRVNAGLQPGSPSNDVLLTRFPELMRAGGGVDPQEAIVALLDRIAELEARLDGTE